MIARDAGRTPKPGLEVYDKDGQKVGYVDQASDAQGWMQVEALGLGLQRLWIPYRLIKSVDGREVMVTLTKDEVGTADRQEVGRIREFDATMGYALIEKGVLSRKRDMIIPLHLVADVDTDEGVVTLAVRKADLEPMRHFEAVNVIVDVPPYLPY